MKIRVLYDLHLELADYKLESLGPHPASELIWDLYCRSNGLDEDIGDLS
jgi:hypothetical protein